MKHCIVYLSSSPESWSDEELRAILAQSRRNNERVGVTGLLLYVEQNFIQVLEGEEAAVRETYRRIAQDDRHRNIIKLLDEPIEDRLFRGWSMGFRSAKPTEVSPLLALARAVTSGKQVKAEVGKEQKGKIFSLLTSFYRVNR